MASRDCDDLPTWDGATETWPESVQSFTQKAPPAFADGAKSKMPATEKRAFDEYPRWQVTSHDPNRDRREALVM